MSERLPDPITVRAEQIPAIWADSIEVQLRFRGDKTWHKATDVSETADGIAIRFRLGTPNTTFNPDELVDVLATKGDPSARWLGG